MDNKVAIITAAGRGMGAACARELAEGNYHVALLSTSDAAKKLAAELGGIGLQGSVTEPEDLAALVSAAMERWGRIDAVVNNTGHPAKGPLLDLSDEDWHQSLDLVVLNAVRMARLVTPIMEKQGGGSIVNISTFAAYEPSLDFPLSSALRGALGNFTKLYARQYGAAGIRMNCVLPGFIDSYPENDETAASIPMKRYGRVVEIAKTVAFLVSDDAGYLTGENLKVDGGLSWAI